MERTLLTSFPGIETSSAISTFHLIVGGYALASFMVMIWDFLSSFKLELELTWRAPKTLLKYIFLWNRYFSIIVGVLATIYTTVLFRSRSAELCRFIVWLPAIFEVVLLSAHMVLIIQVSTLHPDNFVPHIMSVVVAVNFGLEIWCSLHSQPVFVLPNDVLGPGACFRQPTSSIMIWGQISPIILHQIIFLMTSYSAWAHRKATLGLLSSTVNKAIFFYHLFFTLAISIVYGIGLILFTRPGPFPYKLINAFPAMAFTQILLSKMYLGVKSENRRARLYEALGESLGIPDQLGGLKPDADLPTHHPSHQLFTSPELRLSFPSDPNLSDQALQAYESDPDPPVFANYNPPLPTSSPHGFLTRQNTALSQCRPEDDDASRRGRGFSFDSTILDDYYLLSHHTSPKASTEALDQSSSYPIEPFIHLPSTSQPDLERRREPDLDLLPTFPIPPSRLTTVPNHSKPTSVGPTGAPLERTSQASVLQRVTDLSHPNAVGNAPEVFKLSERLDRKRRAYHSGRNPVERDEVFRSLALQRDCSPDEVLQEDDMAEVRQEWGRPSILRLLKPNPVLQDLRPTKT